MTAISRTSKILPNEKSENNFSELLDDARKIAAEVLIEASETDRTDGFPARTFEKLAEAGLTDAVIPEKFGGKCPGTKAGTSRTL